VTRAIHSQCGMHTRTGSKGPKARMIARFMHRRVRCPTRLLLLLPLFHLRAGRKRIFSRGGGREGLSSLATRQTGDVSVRRTRRLIWSLIGRTGEPRSIFARDAEGERRSRAISGYSRSPDARSDRETRRFRAHDAKTDAKKRAPRSPSPLPAGSAEASFPSFWRFRCSTVARACLHRLLLSFPPYRGTES